MFVENIKNWAHAVKPHAGGSVHLEARRPASRRQLGKVERELGRPIPEPIRDLLRRSASRLNFWWDLRDGVMPLGGPDAPSGGYLEFGIEGIAQLDAILGGWVSEGAPS